MGPKENEDILEDIQVYPVEKKTVHYKQKRLNYVSWMEDIRLSEQVLDYRPIGRRRPGRQLKTLLNGYSREAETGHLLA
jgi:hypothetical protein